MNELSILDPRAIDRLRDWGGDELPRKMIDIFLSNSPARLESIRKGLAENDSKEIEAGAHSLKSSAGNVGATQLQRLCMEMERMATDGEMEAMADGFPALENAFDATCEALESVMEGMDE